MKEVKKMFERWTYSRDYRYANNYGVTYYKQNERLTWSFYLRIIKTWFTPCEKCQNVIDALWNNGYFLNAEWYNKFIYRATQRMCEECGKKVENINKTAEVILGNDDYEPPIELSRKWLKIGNKIEITSDEYNKK